MASSAAASLPRRTPDKPTFSILPRMLLDKRHAGGKNCRESQEETSYDWSEAGSDQAGNHGHRSAKYKSNQIFVPVGFA